MASLLEIRYAAHVEYEAGGGKEPPELISLADAAFPRKGEQHVHSEDVGSLHNPALEDLIRADGRITLREVKGVQVVPTVPEKPRARPPGLARHLPKIQFLTCV